MSTTNLSMSILTVEVNRRCRIVGMFEKFFTGDDRKRLFLRRRNDRKWFSEHLSTRNERTRFCRQNVWSISSAGRRVDVSKNCICRRISLESDKQFGKHRSERERKTFLDHRFLTEGPWTPKGSWRGSWGSADVQKKS